MAPKPLSPTTLPIVWVRLPVLLEMNLAGPSRFMNAETVFLDEGLDQAVFDTKRKRPGFAIFTGNTDHRRIAAREYMRMGSIDLNVVLLL